MARNRTDRVNRPILRSSNVYRIVGAIMLIAGQLLETSPVRIWEIELHSNLIQITGFILLLYPLAREAWLLVQDRSKRGNDDA